MHQPLANRWENVAIRCEPMQHEQTIAANDTIRVRLIELAPGEATAWHRHSEVTDTMFGISGSIVVSLEDPVQEFRLAPGMHCSVPPGRLHRVANGLSDAPSQYLLVQGVGRYDFVVPEGAG